ncbi:hypothetical protein H9Q70_008119 [Fusarium xylarioides]|nr:hypothetical protein H9Q70_008119 [Fusarium xylarioides]
MPLPSGRIAFRPLANSLQLQRNYEDDWPFPDLSVIDCRFLWMFVEDLFERFDEHLVPSKIPNSRKGDLTRLGLVIFGCRRLAYGFNRRSEEWAFLEDQREQLEELVQMVEDQREGPSDRTFLASLRSSEL